MSDAYTVQRGLPIRANGQLSAKLASPWQTQKGSPPTGPGTLSGSLPDGITSILGSPATATIRVLYRPDGGELGDGVLVAQTTSAVDGTWQVTGLNPALKYDVVCRRAGYNDLIWANVSPVSTYTFSVSGAFTLGSDGATLNSSVTITGQGPFTLFVSGSPPPGITFAVSGNTVVARGGTTFAGSCTWQVNVLDAYGTAISLPTTLVMAPADLFKNAVIADTPYMWWRLDEVPGAGASIADSSGNGRGATISGTIDTAYSLGQDSLVGDYNKAIRLRDDTAYIRSAANFSFVVTNFAQSISFRADVGASAGVLTMMNQNTDPTVLSGARDRGFVLGSDGLLYYTFWDGSTSRRIPSLAKVNDGNRHIAHVVVGTTTTTLFLDGVSQGSVNFVPGLVTACYMFVGRSNVTDLTTPINTNAGFRGVVDEMAYYNHTLTNARVLAQAQAAGLA